MNTNIIAPVAPQVTDAVLSNNQIANTDLYVSSANNQIQPDKDLCEILSFQQVAIKWFNYKKKIYNKNRRKSKTFK